MTEQEYEIIGADNRLFCKMTRIGDDVVLKTNNSSITLANLASQVVNPRRSRNKRKHNGRENQRDK